MKRKVILYIAMSLDGYIAKQDDNIDFLSIVESPGEDYGYAEFLNNIDTIIWGRRTFDKVLSFGNGVPHKDKKVYVISKTKTGKEEHAEYSNNVVDLINRLKTIDGKDIYCDGGAEIVFLLLKNKLIDRIIVSVIPHLLGDGIRLFKEGNMEQALKFKRSISYPSGLVQLWYDVNLKSDEHGA
ncbi:MAG: dihydrofolate reductase [Saprospiraceae bacterium]|jgi:dihydrofolate reductase|nr:dihydrofolate reductase [Candidatus Parvibacillus calidus]MBX2938165.1 dihydrofolate reductase [Saprospiraceae bacterium]MBX7179265.1 dihydrofolate reductase family protein [Saprospiraceae bacterium]MCB0592223.1 dihydrofolate reductase [Saprospiraceae bacterium]MCO5281888.1 dihydrofolate reductase family protein [Saprospiraceae bacterium]